MNHDPSHPQVASGVPTDVPAEPAQRRAFLHAVAATAAGLLVLPDTASAQSLPGVTATELLVVDDAVREVVRGGELGDIGLLLRAEGGRSGHSLDRSLLELLTAGKVRMEDVFARAEEKAWLLERTKDLQTTAR